MIYPESFEKKIGFEDIRTLLKGRCMSSLGTEWVDNRLKFLTDHAEVVEALEQAREYVRFMQETVDVEENYFDVRQALMRIRPERTYMEELELFDLKRSLRTVIDLIRIITAREEESEECQYPALARMAEGTGRTVVRQNHLGDWELAHPVEHVAAGQAIEA